VLRPGPGVERSEENLLRADLERRVAVRAPRDPDVDGVLIGTAIGAVGGFVVAPYLLCGHGFDDRECTLIVRLVIGVPVTIGGAVTGGLIDHFHSEGVVVWRRDAPGRDVRVAIMPGPRPRANLVVSFR
jgi:predicted MFS family arabinose efflux permease